MLFGTQGEIRQKPNFSSSPSPSQPLFLLFAFIVLCPPSRHFVNVRFLFLRCILNAALSTRLPHHSPVTKSWRWKQFFCPSVCVLVRVREHSSMTGLRMFVYCDVLTCSSWPKAHCHHRASYWQKAGQSMINDCRVSLLFSLPLFSVSFSFPCPQRTWMTWEWRVWPAWLHPAVNSARDAAPISLNHRPKSHSTSARGVPGKCVHLLLSVAIAESLYHYSTVLQHLCLIMGL